MTRTIYQVEQEARRRSKEVQTSNTIVLDFLKNTMHLVPSVQKSDDRAPGWVKPGERHGWHYYVTIARPADGKHPRGWAPPSLGFDFWGSIADREAVSTYHAVGFDWISAISTIVSDSAMPDTADGVYAEFGEMKPSQAEHIAQWGKQIRAFFTAEELQQLEDFQNSER